MMKRIISVFICVVMVAALFAGCASRKPKTFKEVAEAGEEFVKSEGLKDVNVTIEYNDVKAIIEGQYDHAASKGVFSVKIDQKDSSFTLKDLIVLSDNKLYIKIPDTSVMEKMLSSVYVAPDYTEYDEVTYGKGYDEDPDEDEEFITFPDMSELYNMTDEELAEYGLTRDVLDILARVVDENGNVDYDKLFALSEEDFSKLMGEAMGDIYESDEEEGFSFPAMSELYNMSDEELAEYGLTRDVLDILAKVVDENGNVDYDKLFALSEDELSRLMGAAGYSDDDGDYFDYDDEYYDDGMSDIFSMLLGGASDLAGKYISVKLPETKLDKLTQIFEDAEARVYEKLQKLDSEKDYPYVVKYTKEDAKELILSVIDGLKTSKSEIASEFAALITEYLGSDIVKTIEESGDGQDLKSLIGEALDSFFDETDPSDIDFGEEDDFDCIMKSSYVNGKKYETVTEVSVGKGEDKETFKITVVCTKAESEEGFEDRCKSVGTEPIDIFQELRDMFSSLMQEFDIRV